MITLENISKDFPTTACLRNVNLTVEDGEFLCIMGPSGSGKTTLLNIVGALEPPTEGRCIINGTDIYAMTDGERTKYRREHLGFVFQSFNLMDEMTVFENVELPLKLKGLPANERRSRVKDMLARLGISHRAKMYPNELSGGQQQRVSIARAVIGFYSPANTQKEGRGGALILADEPTGNLDSKQGNEVMQLLSELHKEIGATIVMVTHNHRDADYADRIVELFDGRVIK